MADDEVADLRRDLAAAERRAEAAERINAIALEAIARGMRVVELVDVKPNYDGSIMLITPGHLPKIGNDGQLKAALLLASQPYSADSIEHRAVELIEAGEKLLAQYREEQAKAEAEAVTLRRKD